MKKTEAKKFYLAKRYLFAIIAVLAAALIYALWAVHLDKRHQSTSHADACAMTAKLVDPCRPWLTAAVAKYPNISPDTTVGQANAFNARNFTTGSGRSLDAVKVYHVAGQALNADDIYLATHDKFLMLNWKPVKAWADVTTDPTTANGYIDTMANSLKTIPNAKIFLTLWHEPENDVSPGGDPNCTNVTYKGSRGTVAQYKAMWRYVHNRLLSDLTGTPFVVNGSFHNIVFAIDYMNYAPWDCLVPDLYPGDDITDWIVFNAYGGADGLTFAQNVQNYYSMFTGTQYDTTNRHFSTKALGIAEFSARNNTSAQGIAYFNSVKQAVEGANFKKLKLYMVFDDVGPDGNENRASYIKGGIYDKPKADAFKAFATSSAFSDTTLDTVPPTVTFTTPPSGATLSGTVNVKVNATDDTGVTEVKFYANNSMIGDDTQPSDGWSATWNSKLVSNGTHTLTAVAYDAAGNTGSADDHIVVSNAAPPTISSFVANPTSIAPGSTTTLSWVVADANNCTVTPGGPAKTTSTTWTTDPLSTTTAFTLSCVNGGGTSSATTTVTVAPTPQITSFSANPASVAVGSSTTLNWATQNAVDCSVTPNGIQKTTDTSWQTLAFIASGTQNFTLTCENAAGVTSSANTSVTVTSALKPPTNVVLSASSLSVQSGGRVTFAWTSQGSTSCTLNPGAYSAMGSNGAAIVNFIKVNTTYQVTCANGDGVSKSNTISITVTDAPITTAPVILSFYAFPATVAPRQQTRMYWATNNVKSGDCAISPSPLSNTYATGKWTTPKLTATTTYTLTCRNSVGTAHSTATAYVSDSVASLGSNAGNTLSLVNKATGAADGISLASNTTSTTAVPTVDLLTATTGQTVIDASDVPTIPLHSLITLNPGIITNAAQVSQVIRVEFYDSQKLVQTILQAPFAFSTSRLSQSGQHQLLERDYYSDGSSSEASQLITLAGGQKLTVSQWVFISTVSVMGAAILVVGYICVRMQRHHQRLAAGSVHVGSEDSAQD